MRFAKISFLYYVVNLHFFKIIPRNCLCLEDLTYYFEFQFFQAFVIIFEIYCLFEQCFLFLIDSYFDFLS